MPTFSLDDLVKPVTRQEVQASIYQALGILGVKTTSWKPGSVPRAMIVGVSIVLAAFSELQASIAKSGFLALAEGPWLTLVARHVYGIDRIEATFATGEVTLTNGGGGEYILDPDDLIFKNTATDKTYRNSAPVTIGAGLTATVAIRATEIDQLVTTLVGVTCTNAVFVVGYDEETDPALRSRCSEQLGRLSPMGPWDAYASAVHDATRPDGTSIGVTRIRTVKDGFGNVTVYGATASGTVPGGDLAIADDAIQRWAAPLAVTATIVSAASLDVDVTYELWMYNTSGQTDAQVKTTIETRLRAYIGEQPIGGNIIGVDPGKLFVDKLRAVIAESLPQIFHVVLTLPAADVELDANEVAALGTVTGVVHQVPPATGFGA